MAGNTNLTVFFANAQSLRNKFSELLASINENKYDLVCIVESWVNVNMFGDFHSEYEIAGYKMLIYERDQRVGGGVIVYAKNNLNISELNDLKLDKMNESVWLQIKLNGNLPNVRLGIIYRPPNLSQENDLSLVREINHMLSGEENVIVLGDFNLPGIDWESYFSHCERENYFINCFLDNYLDQIVNFPTRGSNLIDLVLTNNSNLCSNISMGSPLGSSDHASISFEIKYEKTQISNHTTVFDYNRGDYDKLKFLMNSVNWEILFEEKTCEEMWDIFSGKLQEVQSECIPTRVLRDGGSRKNPGWFNREVKDALKEKQVAFNNLKRYNTNTYLEIYRDKRDRLKRVIRKNKRAECLNVARDIKNSKRFYSYFGKKSKIKSNISKVKHDGKNIEGGENIANAFNEYFSSVFNKDFGNKTRQLKSRVNKTLDKINININEIRKIIMKLNINKAGGPDEIHARVLREGVDSISVALFLIFCKSFETGVVPTAWKKAHVVPIFKKGSKGGVENYRPVSLTSIVCRIFETLIKNDIVNFLEVNNIILKSQHGFQKNKSCLTNLLEYVNFITGQLDKGFSVDVIFLDFAKAFDKVSHRKLIIKAESLGIRGDLLNWISNWLKNREQRVILNGFKSEWTSVDSGVPQGSVLGPLLFILFINDIESGLENKVWKFADDTKIVSNVHLLEGNFSLQKDIDKVEAWAESWSMQFNVNKCKIMHIGHNNINFNYSMNSQWLDFCEAEKDLGVWFSSNLKQSKQCIEARNKASRVLGFINRNVEYKSREVILKLYKSYVRPHLEYCIQAWKPHLSRDVTMLESVQRRATRMIPGLSLLSYEERLKELNLFSIERRHIRGDMIQIYKIIHGLDRLDFSTFFELTRDVIPYNIKGHSLLLKVKESRLDIRKYFFSVRAVSLWNKLSEMTVSSRSLNVFKINLDLDMNRLGYV